MKQQFKFGQNSFNTQKELFDFLVKNEKSIISKKKALTASAPISVKTIIGKETLEKIEKIKANKAKAKADTATEEMYDDEDIDVVNVIVVGNTMNWKDSDEDVLINDCFKKSINEGKMKIKHLADY